MARNGKKADKSPSFERVDACIRNLQDRHDDCWPNIHITRTRATREAAMAGIVGELQAGHLPFDDLDLRCFTIFALCSASIRKGSPIEARLAYRAIGLLLLTLDDGSSGPLLDVAFPVLSKAIQTAHDDALVIAAIDCLAAASFTGARNAEEAQRSMEAIWRVVVPSAGRSRSGKPKTSPMVLAAAVSAWTFLLTTVLSATTAQRNKADRNGWSAAAIVSLMEMLDADDRRVRMVAGEALAVCVELDLLTGKEMDTLTAKLSDLAAEFASKGTNNTLLREQKELFGQIAAFLDHEEPPTTLVGRSGERQDVMKVSTWVRLVQLNFISKLLSNGFLKHVQRNPLLSKAFSFGRVDGKPLSIQKEESSLTIDDVLWYANHDRDWTWVRDNIFCVVRKDLNRCPEKLLQLGWR
ncbi:unnamed protein product [Urochloa humidicola]